jgi:hypothetical protein
MKTIFLLLVMLFHLNIVKADNQIEKPFNQWTGVYLVRNINDVIHTYCMKDPKMNGENEKAFRDSIAKWAKEKDASWIYGIKLQDDLTFKESRSKKITEQEAKNIVNIFRLFSEVIAR